MVLILDRKPCLRFCTLRDGLYVSRFAARGVEVEKERGRDGTAGCDENRFGQMYGAVRERWQKEERRDDRGFAIVVMFEVEIWL